MTPESASVAESVVGVFGKTMVLYDPGTGRHLARVAALSAAIACKLGLTGEETALIRVAAGLHDIGKVGVPLAIVNKAERLSLTEIQAMQVHALAGGSILEGVDFGGPVAAMVRQHHERLDGSGYPDGLAGEEILPGARIIAVADVVEAMASHRPYHSTSDLEVVMAELRRGRGNAFDPAVVDAGLDLFEAASWRAWLADGGPAAAELHPSRKPPHLTLQQTAVITLLAEGKSAKEIARALNLGLGTVKTHLSRAYAALGAKNSLTAVRAAGLLGPDGR